MFDERAPLVGTPAFFGPPITFLLGPWLLLVLLLVGPFALLFTVLLVAALTAGLLALLVAVVASPYLLIRHIGEHGMPHLRWRVPRHLLGRHRVGAVRIGSPLPKGMS